MKRPGALLLLAAVAALSGCGLQLGWNTTNSSDPPCQGNACADVIITPENHGNTIKNKGPKTVIVSIRWTFGWSCMDSSDVRLGAGQSQTFLNGGYCNPYTAKYDTSGGPAPSPSPQPPRISSFTITPAVISAGQSTVFRAVLEQSAPASGATIAFSSITNTGVTSTIVNMPVSLQFDPGAREGSITVSTQRVTPETTDIVFTAATAISTKSAQLTVR
jgi:hypothetical protein